MCLLFCPVLTKTVRINQGAANIVTVDCHLFLRVL